MFHRSQLGDVRPQHPYGCVFYRGIETPTTWTRSWIEKHAKIMLDREIKSEVEVYRPGNMEEVYNLIEKGLLTELP